jgi:hypothetical protein
MAQLVSVYAIKSENIRSEGGIDDRGPRFDLLELLVIVGSRYVRQVLDEVVELHQVTVEVGWKLSESAWPRLSHKESEQTLKHFSFLVRQ